ncbi:FliH/SctL family protein [Planctomonas psychrotolerans]|uniref:FliH/SctL family protein n=1 Tax=Planctomonas psychrotolerans TaxID=2528712 RepID=UPI001D0CE7AE|nr:FliH/SctL family protein [Planctomonas psychrotolerans]
MSTEIAYSQVAYPRLRDGARERWEAQGTAHGHAAGYAAGLRAAAAELAERITRMEAEHEAARQRDRATADAALATLAAATRALENRILPIVAEAEQVLAATAIDLAEAIVGHDIRSTDSPALAAITRVLASVEPAHVRTVRMNADDLATLDADTRAAVGMHLVADPSLGRGDAIADLPHGFLDARIDTALSRMRAALTEGPS